MAELPPIEHGDLKPNSNKPNRGNHAIAGFNDVADEAARAALEGTLTADDLTRVVRQAGGVAAESLWWVDGDSNFRRLDPAAAQAAAAVAQGAADAAQSTATAAAAAAAAAQSTASGAASSAASAGSAATAAQSTANGAQSAATAAGAAALAAQGSADTAQATATAAGTAAAAARAQQYLAFGRNGQGGWALVALAANQTVPIPGPSAGYIRLLLQVMVNPTTSSAANCGAILQPANLIVWRPFAITQFSTSNVGGSMLVGANAAFVLGNGETFDVKNESGAGAATLFYSWTDIPSTNITLVRKTFNNTITEIIPAVAAGSFRRVLAIGSTQAAAGGGGPRPVFAMLNVDTVSAQPLTYLGTTHLGSQTTLAANGLGGLILNFDTPITTQALQIATRVAPTATPPNVFAAYETLAVGA